MTTCDVWYSEGCTQPGEYSIQALSPVSFQRRINTCREHLPNAVNYFDSLVGERSVVTALTSKERHNTGLFRT